MGNEPEKVWISFDQTIKPTDPPGYWPKGWPAVFKQPRDSGVKYIRADTVEQSQKKGTGMFQMGDLVKKKGKKGQWHGVICGEYSTPVTPEGYCVRSLLEMDSVQLYPVEALEPWDGTYTISVADNAQ